MADSKRGTSKTSIPIKALRRFGSQVYLAQTENEVAAARRHARRNKLPPDRALEKPHRGQCQP